MIPLPDFVHKGVRGAACVYFCMAECTHMQLLTEASGVDPQRAGATGSCETSYLGAWNQTQFSCKSEVHLATATSPGPGVLFDEPQPYNHGEHTCQNPI